MEKISDTEFLKRELQNLKMELAYTRKEKEKRNAEYDVKISILNGIIDNIEKQLNNK